MTPIRADQHALRGHLLQRFSRLARVHGLGRGSSRGCAWVRSGLRLYDVDGAARGAVVVDASISPASRVPAYGRLLDDLPGKPTLRRACPVHGRPASGPQRPRVLYVALVGVDATSDRQVAVWLGPPDESATVAAPWSDAGALAGSADQGLLVVLAYQAADRVCAWVVSSPGADFGSAPASSCSGAPVRSWKAASTWSPPPGSRARQPTGILRILGGIAGGSVALGFRHHPGKPSQVAGRPRRDRTVAGRKANRDRRCPRAGVCGRVVSMLARLLLLATAFGLALALGCEERRAPRCQLECEKTDVAP